MKQFETEGEEFPYKIVPTYADTSFNLNTNTDKDCEKLVIWCEKVFNNSFLFIPSRIEYPNLKEDSTIILYLPQFAFKSEEDRTYFQLRWE